MVYTFELQRQVNDHHYSDTFLALLGHGGVCFEPWGVCFEHRDVKNINRGRICKFWGESFITHSAETNYTSKAHKQQQAYQPTHGVKKINNDASFIKYDIKSISHDAKNISIGVNNTSHDVKNTSIGVNVISHDVKNISTFIKNISHDG